MTDSRGAAHLVSVYALGDGLRVLITEDVFAHPQTGAPEEWVHVSFSRPDRLPTYEEIKLVREACFPLHA